tara:strand:+ start:4508 stop:4744 length:237 start_codon:yes stop_codon:yes gene_type:complete
VDYKGGIILSDRYYTITLDLDAEFLKEEVQKLGYEGTDEQIERLADLIQEEAGLFTWDYAEKIIISTIEQMKENGTKL